jgi:hypothetical protein
MNQRLLSVCSQGEIFGQTATTASRVQICRSRDFQQLSLAVAVFWATTEVSDCVFLCTFMYEWICHLISLIPCLFRELFQVHDDKWCCC